MRKFALLFSFADGLRAGRFAMRAATIARWLSSRWRRMQKNTRGENAHSDESQKSDSQRRPETAAIFISEARCTMILFCYVCGASKELDESEEREIREQSDSKHAPASIECRCGFGQFVATSRARTTARRQSALMPGAR